MRISKKILMGFLVLVLLAWIINLFIVLNLFLVDQQYDVIIEDALPVFTQLGDVHESALKTNFALINFVFSDNVSTRDEIVKELAILEKFSEEIGVVIEEEGEEKEEPKENLELDKVKQSIKIYLDLGRELLQTKDQGGTREEIVMLNKSRVQPSFFTLETLVDAQKNEFQTKIGIVSKRVDNALDNGRVIVIIVSILILFIAIIIAFFVGRGVSRPINNLVKAANEISKGEIDTSIEKETNDEIGDLAEAFERMRISLKAMIDEMK